jgi:hypothetical protein
MRTVHTFLHDLLESTPEVGPIYDEHVRDHGTCLPHVFFGDVTRFAIAEAMRGFRQDVLVRLFNHLEQGLSSDNEEVRELINVHLLKISALRRKQLTE